MKFTQNVLLYLATACALATGCSTHGRSRDEPGQIGELSLPLETLSNRGNRFRLRQAVFLVDRSRAGEPPVRRQLRAYDRDRQ